VIYEFRPILKSQIFSNIADRCVYHGRFFFFFFYTQRFGKTSRALQLLQLLAYKELDRIL